MRTSTTRGRLPEVLWRHQARSNEENIRLPVTDGNDLVAKIFDILSAEFNVNK